MTIVRAAGTTISSSALALLVAGCFGSLPDPVDGGTGTGGPSSDGTTGDDGGASGSGTDDGGAGTGGSTGSSGSTDDGGGTSGTSTGDDGGTSGTSTGAAGCQQDSDCGEGVCIPWTGDCQLIDLTLEGSVFDFGMVDPTPQPGVTVRLTNTVPVLTSSESDMAGVYGVSNVPPGSVLAVELAFPQTDPVLVPNSVRTRMTAFSASETPIPFDPAVVQFGWLAQVATDCGLFSSVDEASGENQGAINTYFTMRSTILGVLEDENGDPVAGIDRAAINVRLSGWTNVHGGPADTDPNPVHTCFLDVSGDGSTYVGTTADQSTGAGRFVMFRARDGSGTGSGVASVGVPGFVSSTVSLKSTGNLGVVKLVQGAEPPVNAMPDFEDDIYPLFTQLACVGCHKPGGEGSVDPDGTGYDADLSGSPDDVYAVLVEPGVTGCDAGSPKRVCVSNPTSSLLVQRPLAEVPPAVEDHPNASFDDLDDVTLGAIVTWIEQGALR